MSDQAPESTEAAASQPADLLENLRELGTALPVSFQPNAHDSGPLLAGVIWYLATGSLVPPRVDQPTQQEVNNDLAEQTRYNEAEAKIAELERKLAAESAGPSPVAPPPVASAPEPSIGVVVGDQGQAGQEAAEAAAAPPVGPVTPENAATHPAAQPTQVDPATAAPVPPPAAPPEGVGS